jgi:hypothetical protein
MFMCYKLPIAKPPGNLPEFLRRAQSTFTLLLSLSGFLSAGGDPSKT